MPRRLSSGFFLGDTAFLSDPKFRALSRRLPDPDDFNSAVGAYWIALASARRNGRPELDTKRETDSRFIGDLEAVGLLTEAGFAVGPFEEWKPKAPQQAVAGAARAAGATRTPLGTYASALDAGTLPTSGVQPSTSPPIQVPLPTSEGESVREGVDDDDPLDVYWRVTGTYPSGAAKDWLTKLANEFGGRETGNAVAAEFVTGERGTVLKRAQNRLRFEKDKRERKAQEKAEAREVERRASIEVTPEMAAEKRRIMAELVGTVKSI